jgi:hypothetical protein
MSFPFVQPYFGLGNSLQTAQAGGAGGIGGWVELARTTLGSAGDDITVGSLADKRYYMVLVDGINTGGIDPAFRLNADTGTNYANRRSENGGADGTNTSLNRMALYSALNTPYFQVGYLANFATKEKLFQGHLVGRNSAGAGNAPKRGEFVGKHAQTTNPISSVTQRNNGTGDHSIGAEVVVLGWDPADTHTTNFWEELASVTTGSAGDTLESGTISAKKYLWIQASYKNDGAADINALPRFNGDAGSNYSSRTSTNGAADNTRTSRTWVDLESGNQRARFANMFIINNASNEKLCIFNQMDYGASGASTAPNRIEGVAKWANTSDQITSIQWNQLDAGDYAAGAELRVWGSD